MSMKGFRQGIFVPANPDKYVGDVTRITYRSSWELSMNKFLDNNPHILRWSSEEIKIPYIKPTDGRIHHYYPDYWIEYVTADGYVRQEVVEVKPEVQTRQPTTRGKRQKTILHEQQTWEINVAKWEAAVAWCNARHLQFRILTEQGLFGRH